MYPMQRIVLCFLPLLLLAAGTTTSFAQECSAVVHPAGKGTCFVTVSRTRPVSPLTVYGRDTRVVIVVEGVHAADKVLLQEDIVQTAAPDLTFTLVKELLNPLSKVAGPLKTIVDRGNFAAKTNMFVFQSGAASNSPAPPNATIVRDELIRLQDERQVIADKVKADAVRVEAFLRTAADLNGESKLDDFKIIRTSFASLEEKEVDLCSKDQKDLDGRASCMLRKSRSLAMQSDALLDLAQKNLSTQELRLFLSDFGDLKADAATLIEVAELLTQGAKKAKDTDELAGKVITQETARAKETDKLCEKLTSPACIKADWEHTAAVVSDYSKDTNRTLTVNVENLADKDMSRKLVSFVVDDRSTQFEASTGAIFSLMPIRSFKATPQFNADGSPRLSGTSPVLQYKQYVSQPTVVFPFVMGHYRITRERDWGGKAAALTVGGGVGLNLSSSTADFGAGPSLRWGNIFLSTLVHIGQEKRIADGVVLDRDLPTGAPDPPTVNRWVRKLGFALSYRL